MRYRWLALIILMAGMLGVRSTPRAQAQDRQCFPGVPGITHCIEGRFLEYWRQNGGLPVFGYPITEARQEKNRDTGQTYLTQWFERNRFELHPEKQRPYDVLLGRLGDDRLLQTGRTWQEFEVDEREQGCLYFEATKHTLCDQEQRNGFMTYWQTHGLEFDGKTGTSYAESLALFGLPISDTAVEINTSGDAVWTQWFERARFEWHPGNPKDFRVLLGLLGNEVRQNPRQNQATNCEGVKAGQNGSAEPRCVKFGEQITVVTTGLRSGTTFNSFIVDYQGNLVGGLDEAAADNTGGTRRSINTRNWGGEQLSPGDYAFVVEVPGAGYAHAIVPFRVIP